MFFWTLILTILIGYLLGSVSISILLSKYVYHTDVRTQGSGNAGATNVARTFGLRAGLLTFLGDFLKCIVSAEIGRLFGGTVYIAVACAACLLGHCFPLFFGFRGGKAVSVGAAVGLLLDWKIFLLILAVFAAVAFLTKLVSLASISASAVMSVSALLLLQDPFMKALAVFTTVLVIFMHRSNIRRLLSGSEPKFRFGQKPPKQ